jgi:cardiolipin synthase A/B
MILKKLVHKIATALLVSGLFVSTGCGQTQSFNGFIPNSSQYMTSFQTSYSMMSVTQQQAPNYGPGGISSEDGLMTLYVEPEAGVTPIVNALNSAKKSIDIQIYMLTNYDVLDALKAATKRGVTVRLLMEKEPFNPSNPASPLTTNIDTANKLTDSGILIKWSNKAKFNFTHQKSILIDNEVGIIMSLNLTRSAVVQNREYFVFTKNPTHVKEMENIFNADWNDKNYVPGNINDLVLSPVNSRAQFAKLIQSATKDIKIEFEVMSDDQLFSLLGAKAKQGVNINIIVEPSGKASAQKLKALGVNNVNFIDVLTLHAKLIVIDGVRAYFGSINMTNGSMEKNRELGIIVNDKNLLQKLTGTFGDDWKNSKPF